MQERRKDGVYSVHYSRISEQEFYSGAFVGDGKGVDSISYEIEKNSSRRHRNAPDLM